MAAEEYVMLALVPPEEFRQALADPTGEPAEEHHITLFFLGTTDEVGGVQGRVRLEGAVLDFCAHAGFRELVGRLGGYGVFPPSAGRDGQYVLCALWDVLGLAEFRTALGRYLDMQHVRRRPETYGFIPHETIGYSPDPIGEIPTSFPAGLPDTASFGHVVLAWAGEWVAYQLPSAA